MIFFLIFSGPLTFKDESGKHSVIGVVSFGPKTCVDPGLLFYWKKTCVDHGLLFYYLEKTFDNQCIKCCQ